MSHWRYLGGCFLGRLLLWYRACLFFTNWFFQMLLSLKIIWFVVWKITTFFYTGDQWYQHRTKLWLWNVCSCFRNGPFIVCFLFCHWFIAKLCRFHSSAIAAAREALVYGVPSIAISLNWWDASTCIEFVFQIFYVINIDWSITTTIHDGYMWLGRRMRPKTMTSRMQLRPVCHW